MSAAIPSVDLSSYLDRLDDISLVEVKGRVKEVVGLVVLVPLRAPQGALCRA